MAAAAMLAGGTSVLGVCGPFTDTANDAFCTFVLEIFHLAITTGTTPTTYDPNSNVTRLQMAAFLSRSVDRVLNRSARRTAMGQFSVPGGAIAMAQTTLPGPSPYFAVSDGTDIWVPSNANQVTRVHGSDGRILETWTGGYAAFSLVSALGRIFVNGVFSLYMIDPRQPAGAMTTVASGLPNGSGGMAFDGQRLFIPHQGSVVIAFPSATIPFTTITVSSGFNSPLGAVFDGSNVWVTDAAAGTLLKLDSGGTILQTVTIGFGPEHPVFDGTNILVPTDGNIVAVVRPATGLILTTLTGNGLNHATNVASDGERVLVANEIGNSVSLWKAADFTPLGSFSTGASSFPFGVCSDGVDFWIVLQTSPNGRLARF